MISAKQVKKKLVSETNAEKLSGSIYKSIKNRKHYPFQNFNKFNSK
jgi:hypothetical protein